MLGDPSVNVRLNPDLGKLQNIGNEDYQGKKEKGKRRTNNKNNTQMTDTYVADQW